MPAIEHVPIVGLAVVGNYDELAVYEISIRFHRAGSAVAFRYSLS